MQTAQSVSRSASPDAGALSLRADECAIFLDVDGTLLEFAPFPDAVYADMELLDLLRCLWLHTRGAVALISGRSIASLDALLIPMQLPASGLHGFELRGAEGMCMRCVAPPPETLRAARTQMTKILARDSRLVLENKRFGFALHYRQVPQLEQFVVSEMEAISRQFGDSLSLLRGRMVVELAPPGVSKANAIARFMRMAPFNDRMPVYLGDDLSDEPGFEWVNAAGGVSIGVNVARPTAAAFHLKSVTEARNWLRGLLRWGLSESG